MITDVVGWVQKRKERPWVVVGKGPSFAERDRYPLHECRLLTLNHACLRLKADLAHFTDLEAYRSCTQHLAEDNHSQVVLPWHPHENMEPHPWSLMTLVENSYHHDRSLYRLSQQGRLLSYNSSRVPATKHKSSLCTIRVRYFSAVAAVNILAAADVKTIWTLGIDGGHTYAPDFDQADCLKNGRPSFDVQFREFERTQRTCQVMVRPLREKRW